MQESNNIANATMYKYVVVCGQDLDNYSLIDHPSFTPAVEYDIRFFPEANGGANFVESLVEKVVKSNRRNIFLTRYGFILNKIGGMISDGLIQHEDVIVHLLNEGKWSEHTFTYEGFLSDGWPFGVLGY